MDGLNPHCALNSAPPPVSAFTTATAAVAPSTSDISSVFAFTHSQDADSDDVSRNSFVSVIIFGVMGFRAKLS